LTPSGGQSRGAVMKNDFSPNLELAAVTTRSSHHRMSMISVVAGLGQLPLNVTRHGGNEGQGHVPLCKLADRL